LIYSCRLEIFEQWIAQTIRNLDLLEFLSYISSMVLEVKQALNIYLVLTVCDNSLMTYLENLDF
jgi:hypothetical protein